MKAIRLVIEPFQFVSLLEVKCVKELNEHGYLKISGIISEEDGVVYQDTFYKEQLICVKAVTEENTEIILFQGVVTSMSLQLEGQVNELNIEAKTGSYLLSGASYKTISG